jgi:hypothetical protein
MKNRPVYQNNPAERILNIGDFRHDFTHPASHVRDTLPPDTPEDVFHHFKNRGGAHAGIH